MRTLAVAGLSARTMAQAAAHDGYSVTALDIFGDADTLRAAARWLPIGDARCLRIDGARFVAALQQLRDDHDGWVAGSGFESEPELLAQGAAVLPLVGTAPDAVARLRDPAVFFDFLRESGIAHPPVLLSPAGARGAWLLKDFRGSGGRHIRHWTPAGATGAEPLAPGQYLQRAAEGVPMSATVVAGDADVRLLGVNQQIVRAVGARPHVVCGVLGPLPVADALRQALTGIARRISARFALRGLASVDLLVDGDAVRVLEVNPRPPASMALYGALRPMAAHVQACLHGELPTLRATAPLAGHEVVFAQRTLVLTPAQAAMLASCADVHDLPAAGQTFDSGDPLCSVSASGGTDGADVLVRLALRRDALLRSLETHAS